MPEKSPGSNSRPGRNLEEARRIFHNLPRIPLITPLTAIERCDRLRQAIPRSPEIYVKRDDQQAFLCGGNKLRKLEYIMADVLRHRATTVLTMGGTHSNHARITAMVARRTGLKSVLVLNGERGQSPKGNLLLNHLLGIDIHYVESREEREPRVQELAKALTKQGERVYVVPLGSSNEVGSFGLAAAMEEIAAAEKQLGINFDTIIVSSSSGGTQAGLEVGRRLFGLERSQVIGVSPDDSAAAISANITKAMNPMFVTLGLDGEEEAAGITVDDGFVGEAYGIPSPASQEAFYLWSKFEGILLDPVYTAKASAALFSYIKNGRFHPSEKVLFWHTGGLINLFGGPMDCTAK